MPAPAARYLSLALPHLPTDRIARARWGRSWLCDGRPEDAPPLAVTGFERSTQRLVALEPLALERGLQPGQKLADARALIPGLDAVPEAPDQDARLLAQVAAWCDRYTPLVALDGGGDPAAPSGARPSIAPSGARPSIAPSGAGGLMLDVTGCAHLFGGEAALLADLLGRLRAQGLHARAAIAGTVGAAWALARFGAPAAIAAPGDSDPLMALPLAALRLDAAMLEGLGRVGFRSVGCLAPLPRAPLATRFGPGLMTRLDQALGRAPETLSPLRPPAELAAERRFAEPVTRQEDIERAIALLAGALAPMLEARGLGARGIELRLFRVDGAVQALAVEAATALRDPGRIAALYRERIAGLAVGIDAGYGFDLVKLAVLRSEPFAGSQGDLVDRRAPQDRFAALVERLGARLGPDRVRVFAGADTHIPERGFGTVPAARARPGQPAAGPGAALPVPPLTRPVYLLARPEPVETLAEVPDGPPIRFRWRRVPYAVARSEGPERIACEWWKDGRAGLTRDYFRVEAAEGHRFWMFRQGLYARETTQPRWYMHGLYA